MTPSFILLVGMARQRDQAGGKKGTEYLLFNLGLQVSNSVHLICFRRPFWFSLETVLAWLASDPMATMRFIFHHGAVRPDWLLGS